MSISSTDRQPAVTPDPWLVDALRDIRRIAELPDPEAIPPSRRTSTAGRPRTPMARRWGNLLDDPTWDRREVRQAMIRLRASIQHEIQGRAKTLTWHATQMRAEVARLRADYPAACQEVDADLTILEEAERRGAAGGITFSVRAG